MNGRAFGSVASKLLKNNMDLNCLRPYEGRDGRTYIDKMVNNKLTAVPVHNAEATLPYEAWRMIDDAVVRTARPELRLIAALQSAGLTQTVDAMSLITMSYQVQKDAHNARVVMSPLVRAERDRPTYDIRDMPLPLIEAEFSYDIRELNVSRRGGQPLDLTSVENCTRRVMELAEDFVLGNSGTFSYAGGTVYGLTNFPQRLTADLTLPTDEDWTPEIFLDEINLMMKQSRDQNFFGPWMMFMSPGWDFYLNKDYSAAYPGSLRTRVQQITSISGIMELPRLSDYQIILLQMNSNTIRLINGLPLRVVQWEGPGGWEVHFKLITSIVPQMRYDAEDQTGIVHGVAA